MLITFLDETRATLSTEILLTLLTFTLSLLHLTLPTTLPYLSPTTRRASPFATRIFAVFFGASCVRYAASSVVHSRATSSADVLSADVLYSSAWRVAMAGGLVQTGAALALPLWLPYARSPSSWLLSCTSSAAAAAALTAWGSVLAALPTLSVLAIASVPAYTAAALGAAAVARVGNRALWVGCAGWAVLALIAACEPWWTFEWGQGKKAFTHHSMAVVAKLFVYPAIAFGGALLSTLVVFPSDVA